jgi:hypothetical protein
VVSQASKLTGYRLPAHGRGNRRPVANQQQCRRQVALRTRDYRWREPASHGSARVRAAGKEGLYQLGEPLFVVHADHEWRGGLKGESIDISTGRDEGLYCLHVTGFASHTNLCPVQTEPCRKEHIEDGSVAESARSRERVRPPVVTAGRANPCDVEVLQECCNQCPVACREGIEKTLAPGSCSRSLSASFGAAVMA